MAVDIMDDFELERLRAEIQQERQMKEMLDQSSAELRTTVEELDRRLETIGDEGNEWKTRFETQEEMNQQLQKQILMLQTKVEEARKNLKDAGRTPRDLKNFDDLSDANPMLVKALEKDKQGLVNQLRDLEWRLDQESKVYHKANDERKQYVLEINSTKSNINELRVQSKASGESARTNKTPRNADGNIPDDQRIIDPRKGPIRKTAGVKSLPSIDSYY